MLADIGFRIGRRLLVWSCRREALRNFYGFGGAAWTGR